VSDTASTDDRCGGRARPRRSGASASRAAFLGPARVITEDEDFIARRIDPLPEVLDRPSMTFAQTKSGLTTRRRLTVLVDPCNGSGTSPECSGTSTISTCPGSSVARPLASLPNAIDVVFCTHLHNESLAAGNTMNVDGRWVPPFPQASYVFVDAEYRRWEPTADHIRTRSSRSRCSTNVCGPWSRPVSAKLVVPPHSVSPTCSSSQPGSHRRPLHLAPRVERQSGLLHRRRVPSPQTDSTRPELHLPGCDVPSTRPSAQPAAH